MMFNSFSLWKDQSWACHHRSWMDQQLSWLICTNLNHSHKSMTLASPRSSGFYFLMLRVKRTGLKLVLGRSIPLWWIPKSHGRTRKSWALCIMQGRRCSDAKAECGCVRIIIQKYQPSCWGHCATLTLSFCFRALLVIGWIFAHKKKGVKMFHFIPPLLFKDLQLWLFLDDSFVLASAQKKKVPFQ